MRRDSSAAATHTHEVGGHLLERGLVKETHHYVIESNLKVTSISLFLISDT